MSELLNSQSRNINKIVLYDIRGKKLINEDKLVEWNSMLRYLTMKELNRDLELDTALNEMVE